MLGNIGIISSSISLLTSLFLIHICFLDGHYPHRDGTGGGGAGWYIKDLSGIAMIADWDEEKFKDNGIMNFYHMDRIKTKKEPFEVDYCGFGFTKISTKLIKQLQYPYFRQKVVNIGQYTENVSEDASFCLDIAQKTGVKPKIIPSLKINHLKEIFI